MKKKGLVLISIMLVLCAGWAEEASDSLLDTFITNFAKGSPEVKLEVLKDAVNLGLTGMGPLYLDAIEYVIDHASQLDTDLIYRQLSRLAVDYIEVEKYTKAKDALWQLFKLDTNTTVRVQILSVLNEIGVGDATTIQNVTSWLENQNNIFLTGKTPDLPVVSASIETLGIFGDPVSFPVLFRALVINYSDAITTKAEAALEKINGDFKQLYLSVIKNGFFEEKKLALAKSIARSDFTDAVKCEIAEFALNIALYSSLNTPQERELARQTRYMAVDFLGKKNYSQATELLIEHFNRTIKELDDGVAGKNFFLDAIEALGNMQTHEAAKRLTLHLDLINSFTENGRAYDEQVVIALILALENLGDKVASGTLLYTKYLNYSDRIKTAAAKAAKSLQ